jgi:hypothetical protein
MSSESVCQVAHIWVDVGSFHARLMVRFTSFTALIQNILDTPSYAHVYVQTHILVLLNCSVFRHMKKTLPFGKLHNTKHTTILDDNG